MAAGCQAQKEDEFSERLGCTVNGMSFDKLG